MKRFRILLGVLIGVTALVALVPVWMRSRLPTLPRIRALWVTRFDYETPGDVQRIIQNVSNAGFTDVFFQIRGNGTVFYQSQTEPWAYELSGRDVSSLGKNPGWDPLDTAIDAARSSGLRVHAYMNVLPGWKGLDEPSREVGQLWTAHPDWFMVDSLGEKMKPTAGWYAFVNPVVPQVRSHLRDLVAELCRYDVAGIHLDYIRYPYDYHLVARQCYPDASAAELLRHSDFSYDPVSQAALFDEYGWNVSRKQISTFRCKSITRIVRDIAYVLQINKPGSCLLSTSVVGNPVEGKNSAYQDSGAWVRQGLVDWVVQMNYASRSFSRNLEAMKKAAGRRGFRTSVVVGIYCKNSMDDLREQLEMVEASGCRGYSIFSYSLLFDKNHVPTEKGRMLLKEIRPRNTLE